MKKMFLVSSTLIFALNLFAADQVNCDKILENLQPQNNPEDITMSDPYRWLEEDSTKREEWLKAQKYKTSRYLKSTDEQIKNYWKKILGNKFLNPLTIDEIAIDDQTKIQLVLNGMSKGYEVNLLKNNQVVKNLFSSKISLNSKEHFGIMDIWTDPSNKILLVPVSYNGSTDIIDIHVIDVATGNKLDLIKEANNVEPVWLYENVVIYRKLLKRDYISLAHKIGSKYDQIDSFNYGGIETTPHKKFTYYDEKKSLRIKRIDQDEYTKLSLEASSFDGETDNALFFSQKIGGLNYLHRLPLINGGESFGEAKAINTGSGVLAHMFDDKNTAFAYYRLGTQQWGILVNETGDVVDQISLPTACQVVGYKKIDQDRIEIAFSSQILEKRKIVYNLKYKNFVEDVEKVLQTDAEGREFVSTIIKAKSKDGQEFPVRVTHLKGTKLDGQNPSLVEGYGGFGVPGYFYPKFDYKIKELLNNGGVYAAPILRGGDELGGPWRQQATLAGKQNTFDDMATTLRTIQQLGYTSPKKTAVMGWSNGGLLIGSMAVQYPELFSIGIAGNGVLDMLRKDYLDPRYADGWSYEYGDLQSSTNFSILKKYSPVHNAKEREYPTVIVVNGTSDSRVNPIHSFKFAAALQDAQKGEKPIMLLPVENSGHWVTSRSLEDTHAYVTLLYIWSAIFNETGVEINE